MQLDEVELFALNQLFNADGGADETVQAFHYAVQQRCITAAGFFSIIKCLHPSAHIQPRQETSKTFTHPLLKKGGMFVCWVEPDMTLCLEGAAAHRNWPVALMPRALQASCEGRR